MAYRGPQEDAQGRVPGIPNNGNPQGANNMPANDPYGYLPGDPRNRRGASDNPRYTAPTVDPEGRVTNSDLQNFALPTFNYNQLMGLQPGVNPFDVLRQLFGGGASMLQPTPARPHPLNPLGTGYPAGSPQGAAPPQVAKPIPPQAAIKPPAPVNSPFDRLRDWAGRLGGPSIGGAPAAPQPMGAGAKPIPQAIPQNPLQDAGGGVQAPATPQNWWESERLQRRQRELGLFNEGPDRISQFSRPDILQYLEQYRGG